MRQHFLRLAAQQQAADAAPAVRGHEDQIAAVVGGRLDDALVRPVALRGGAGLPIRGVMCAGALVERSALRADDCGTYRRECFAASGQAL